LNCKPILRLRIFGNTTRNDPANSGEIWLGKREDVLYQFQPWFRVVCNHHLDDIETKKNVGIIQHSQPIECTARNASLFALIDSRDGATEIPARARLYFDEYERLVIPANDIDLAAATPFKVAVENPATVTTQEATRQFLAIRAASEVLRLG
jgi:hypothetical protein